VAVVQGIVGFVSILLDVIEADAALLVEEVHIAEVTHVAMRLELELGGPVILVEGEDRIIMQIQTTR
jgi:hypothetical protein